MEINDKEEGDEIINDSDKFICVYISGFGTISVSFYRKY